MFKELGKKRGVCPICEIETDLVFGDIKETLQIRKHNIEVTSKVHRCKNEGHEFALPIDEAATWSAAYKEYRKSKGIIFPETIKANRERVGLSQKDFARFLDWGEITIQRYEAGALPDSAHNEVLQMLGDYRNLRDFCYKHKERIGLVTYDQVLSRIRAVELKEDAEAFGRVISRRKRSSERSILASDFLYDEANYALATKCLDSMEGIANAA